MFASCPNFGSARSLDDEICAAKQRCRKRGYARLTFGGVRAKIHKHANPPRPGGLLRLRSERPCRSASKPCDELPPSHANPQKDQTVTVYRYTLDIWKRFETGPVKYL